MARDVRAPRLVVSVPRRPRRHDAEVGARRRKWRRGFSPAAGQNGAGYFRQPAIWNETLVFTAEGDLWRVPLAGGVPERLTSHPGQETNAVISPDGSTVVFSGTYEGPRELYQLPLDRRRATPPDVDWRVGRGRGLDARRAEVLYTTDR